MFVDYKGRPLFVLGTWRTEDVPVDHRLRELLTETQRSGSATSLSLRRLTPQDVSEILDVVPAGRSVADVRSAVYAETEGLPLFVVEYLKVVRSGPVESEGALPMPPTVRNVLRSRINTVSEGARQLLSAAAVVERSFDYETIRSASGRSETETVTSLEELAARSLLVEVDGSDSTSATYEFSHQRLRELVYQETSLARRRLLHRRVAESLERRSGGRRDQNELASQIAHHYQSAGHEAKAADYHKIAGEHARSLFANEEALVHLNSALAFDHPDVAELHESIGDLQTLVGDYGSAISSYETAAATSEVEHVARLEHKLGNVHQRRGDLDLAQSHYESAAGMMDETLSPSAVSRVYSDASLNAYQRGELDQAKALGQEALDLAEKSEVIEALAQAHNVLGILQKSTGELDSAATQLEKSLAYARELDDRAVELAALNNLALCQAASGRVDQAVETEQTALKLCDLIGDRHREAAIRNNLADLYHQGGSEDKAMEELKRAVAIFADIGSRGTETRPEIWKLVEW